MTPRNAIELIKEGVRRLELSLDDHQKLQTAVAVLEGALFSKPKTGEGDGSSAPDAPTPPADPAPASDEKPSDPTAADLEAANNPPAAAPADEQADPASEANPSTTNIPVKDGDAATGDDAGASE